MTFTYVFTYFIVTVLCASIGLVVYTHISLDMGSEREIRAFKGFVLFFVFFCLTNSVWIWMNFGYLHLDGTVNSILNLLSITISSYFWFVFVELKLNPLRSDTLGFRMLGLVPLIIATGIIITTPWTGLVFYYDENNQYIHGPLYTTMVLLALFYIMIATVELIFRRIHTKSTILKNEYTLLLQLLIYPVIGGVVDVMFPNLPVMELSIMVGMVIIFTNLQNSRIYNDSLTNMNNRRRAEFYVEDLLDIVSEEEPFYFFIGDANRFKEINDRYGHTEGDRALQMIASVLKDAGTKIKSHVARWGGDEFVIIGEEKNIGDPEEVIGMINDKLEEKREEEGLPYHLSLCLGYAKCVSQDENSASLLARADKMMYEKKGGAR